MFRSFVAAQPATTPCIGYPTSVLYADVDPEVLAHEEANEVSRIATPPTSAWQVYLRRILPALERNAAAEMAEGLIAAGHGVREARSHAATMRRQAVKAGNVSRVRFWGEVLEALPPEEHI